MIRKPGILLLAMLIAIVFVLSCNRVKKPEVVINKDLMTDILTDLYLADGLLSIPPVRSDFGDIDSTGNYMRVIEDHGFTMADFEANIGYYFKAEPKKYQEIYDEVLATLSEMESEITQSRRENNPSSRNLWNGKPAYRMPDDGTSNPVEFEIPVSGPGVYLIRARFTLYDDDQSINPRSTIYFWYDDGTEEGYRDMWESQQYEKGPRSQQLRFRKVLEDTLVTHIRGRLIDFTPQPGHWEMHSSLSAINVSFVPADEGEDIPVDL